MNVADRTLCQELYEVSGWDCEQYFNAYGDVLQIGELDSSNATPAYDLGYLLRMLPASIESQVYEGRFAKLETRKDSHPNDREPSPVVYFAWYLVIGITDVESDFGVHADTPEDAAAKLAIEMFKQKVLTK